MLQSFSCSSQWSGSSFLLLLFSLLTVTFSPCPFCNIAFTFTCCISTALSKYHCLSWSLFVRVGTFSSFPISVAQRICWDEVGLSVLHFGSGAEVHSSKNEHLYGGRENTELCSALSDSLLSVDKMWRQHCCQILQIAMGHMQTLLVGDGFEWISPRLEEAPPLTAHCQFKVCTLKHENAGFPKGRKFKNCQNSVSFSLWFFRNSYCIFPDTHILSA